ncbi:hypothetical protein JOB18_028113 [Solea senegalensis]|uniref:Uncharacterized protein n=1 Tax=Solea senegalensis TaxID=28829 RepID=A0AAV6SEP6_SOLSE|nr:hypothetical protein JOB18_028113 [Solea senegalensis]
METRVDKLSVSMSCVATVVPRLCFFLGKQRRRVQRCLLPVVNLYWGVDTVKMASPQRRRYVCRGGVMSSDNGGDDSRSRSLDVWRRRHETLTDMFPDQEEEEEEDRF